MAGPWEFEAREIGAAELKSFLRMVCIALLVGAWCLSAPLYGADQSSINAAIQRGRAYLQTHVKSYRGGEKSLAAYALLKTGSNKRAPEIEEAIQAALKEAEFYQPGQEPPGADQPYAHREFAYTVPCHLFLFEAADPVEFKPQIAALSQFLWEQQEPNGSWCYVNYPAPDPGDTSQLQFALLGLWAAARADIDVPGQAFQKAAQWLLKTQLSEGGFAYQPVSGVNADQKAYRYSTTLGGVSSLLLVRYLYFPGVPFGENAPVSDGSKSTKPGKKFGVLDRLGDEGAQPKGGDRITLNLAGVDKSISRAMKLVDEKFTTEPFYNCHMYVLYSMERAAALLDSDHLGSHDWFAEASDAILRYQLADGSWNDFNGSGPSTSFALLCLSKATSKIVGRTPEKTVGGGLLSGARGLPGDLSKLQVKDGQASERKSLGTVDDLLADLEKTSEISVKDVQEAVLETVNLDDPQQLVGAIERLRRLAGDPRADVRRTALWAMGRTGDVRLAPLLIAALSDEDAGVIREASYGLAILSRKPAGLVNDKGKAIPIEPLEGLDEEAEEDQEREALRAWQTSAIPAWKSWYLSVRPYDERDDRQQLQKKR